MTPDMPVIKGPAERCAEKMYGLGLSLHPRNHAVIVAVISAEYASERREMVRVSVQEQLNSMTDEQRMDIFSQFCRHCGSTNPHCQCWNDE